MSEATSTVLQLNLEALTHNYKFLKSKLQNSTKFLAVVKAFAYGSDMIAIAQKLAGLGVDYFAVAYVKEGVQLRDAGIETPILVLHPQAVNFQEIIDRCLEPSLYSPRILKQFLHVAKENNQRQYPVHLKFNTGLNRLGFWENDIDYIMLQIKGRNEIKIQSVFSHLAASDDLNEKEFTKSQIRSFEAICQDLEGLLEIRPMRHLLNTSGILNFPEAQFDMVRSGIGLYGYGNDPEIDAQLKPVATLKTVISQIHKIEPDESVGYNRAYKARDFGVIATLPLGHADGIGRIYGNGVAKVKVNGKPAPIIGNVCMDMLMVDITGIACKEGDEVLVFGEGHSAEDFAKTARTISYELITGISQRVQREILPRSL